MEDILFERSITLEKFCSDIEQLVLNGDVDYIDAIVYYCEKNNIEIEVAAQYIKQNVNLKLKVQCDGELLNYLPKRAKLPL